jgi:hypothetical protein
MSPTVQDEATCLRCGGCGDSVLLTQGGRRYGRLVHGFLHSHERCAGAVEITRSHTAPAGAAPAGIPAQGRYAATATR